MRGIAAFTSASTPQRHSIQRNGRRLPGHRAPDLAAGDRRGILQSCQLGGDRPGRPGGSPRRHRVAAAVADDRDPAVGCLVRRDRARPQWQPRSADRDRCPELPGRSGTAPAHPPARRHARSDGCGARRPQGARAARWPRGGARVADAHKALRRARHGFFPARLAEVLERLPEIVSFAEIEEFLDMPLKHYSSGMYLRLAFSVAIHMDPDVLIVDEALSVGDMFFQQRCMRRIQQLKSQGVTIVFVSHDLEAVRSLADRTIWMEHGRIKAQGSPVEVIEQYISNAHG